MDIGKLRCDTTASEDGIWREIDGTKFKVRRANSSVFQRELVFAIRKIGYPDFEKPDDLPENIKDEQCWNYTVQREAESRSLLADWSGLLEDGKEIPYSPEKAYELMTTIPEIYQIVVTIANDSANFKQKIVEQVEGNSETASNGS